MAKEIKLTVEENLVIDAFRRGVVVGRNIERENLIGRIWRKICFDHIEENTCSHAACFELRDLAEKVRADESK